MKLFAVQVRGDRYEGDHYYTTIITGNSLKECLLTLLYETTAEYDEYVSLSEDELIDELCSLEEDFPVALFDEDGSDYLEGDNVEVITANTFGE